MSNYPNYGANYSNAPPPSYQEQSGCPKNPRQVPYEVPYQVPYHSQGNRFPAPGYQYVVHDGASEDDFLLAPTLSQCGLGIRQAFVAKVYSILMVQILATIIFSLIFSKVDSVQMFLFRHIWVVYGSMILGFINLLLLIWKRQTYPVNFILLSTFTFLESVSIGVIVSFYSSTVVIQALVLTFGIFIVLTLVATKTNYDFSAWQPYLYSFLWLLILVPLLQFFIPFSSGFELLLAVGSALLFSAYILVDTHNMMTRLNPDEYIMASVELYMDVLNLFLALLRILSSRED